METNKLLTIDPGPLSQEEYRRELIAALTIAMKKPFSGESGDRGEGVTAFEQEEATGYFYLIDLLQKLLADTGAVPEPVNLEA